MGTEKENGMMMKLSEAKAECQRWLDYLEDQERKTIELQKLAADRRAGRCDAADGERHRAEIQGNGLTVYDGSSLADAVKAILKHV